MRSGARSTVLCLSLVFLLLVFLSPSLHAEDYSSDQFLSEPFEELEEEPESPTELGDEDFSASTTGEGFYWFLLKLAGGLGIVVLSIWGLGKFLKNSGIGNSSNQFMKVHSTLPLSRDQFLRITQIGKKFVVIGVTGDSINKICEITDPDVIQELKLQNEASDKEQEESDFSDLLQRFLGGADHSFRRQEEQQDMDTLKQKLQEMKGQGEVGG